MRPALCELLQEALRVLAVAEITGHRRHVVEAGRHVLESRADQKQGLHLWLAYFLTMQGQQRLASRYIDLSRIHKAHRPGPR